MTKSDLIFLLSLRSPGISPRRVDMAVKGIFDYLSTKIKKGEKVEIRGFGSFTLRTRPKRLGRNPKTGETVYLPERSVVFFKPGKDLRDRVNTFAKKRIADGSLQYSENPSDFSKTSE